MTFVESVVVLNVCLTIALVITEPYCANSLDNELGITSITYPNVLSLKVPFSN